MTDNCRSDGSKNRRKKAKGKKDKRGDAEDVIICFNSTDELTEKFLTLLNKR